MPPANRPPNDDLAPGKSHPRSRATAEKSTSSTSDQFRLPSVYPTWSPTSTFEPSSSNPLRQPLHFEGSRLDVDPQTSLGHHQEPRRPDSFIVPVTISPQSLQRHPGDRLSFDYSSSAYYPSSHGLIDYGNPFDRTNATSTASLGDLGILTTTASDMNELAPMAFMGTGASHSSICVTNSGSEANVSQEVTTTPFMKSESEESQNNFAGEPQSNVEDLVFMSHTINLEPEQDVQQGAHPAPSSGSCFKCGICEKTFTRSYNLQNHQQTHEVYRERPFVCMRWGCFKGFYRPSELKRHELSVHVKVKDFVCDACHRAFPRKDTLQRHKADGCYQRPNARARQRKERHVSPTGKASSGSKGKGKGKKILDDSDFVLSSAYAKRDSGSPGGPSRPQPQARAIPGQETCYCAEEEEDLDMLEESNTTEPYFT